MGNKTLCLLFLRSGGGEFALSQILSSWLRLKVGSSLASLMGGEGGTKIRDPGRGSHLGPLHGSKKVFFILRKACPKINLKEPLF